MTHPLFRKRSGSNRFERYDAIIYGHDAKVLRNEPDLSPGEAQTVVSQWERDNDVEVVVLKSTTTGERLRYTRNSKMQLRVEN